MERVLSNESCASANSDSINNVGLGSHSAEEAAECPVRLTSSGDSYMCCVNICVCFQICFEALCTAPVRIRCC